MKTALYCAGLGDVIRQIYQNASYKFLSETTTPVPVIVASHNPFTIEIFRHHRNARHFILYDMLHKFEEFFDAGLRGPDINRALCEFAGQDYAQMLRGNADGHIPIFDAPDDMDSHGHIVLQPFAGNAFHRTLPEDLTARIVEVLRAQSRQVFIITRSYHRKGATKKIIHADEDARRFAGGNITVVENLTVPASLNLVRSSSAYIGSWSSLQQAAWFENKPVTVYYPVNYTDVVNRTSYAFGLDRDDCLHAEYPAADMTKLAAWLERLK